MFTENTNNKTYKIMQYFFPAIIDSACIEF